MDNPSRREVFHADIADGELMRRIRTFQDMSGQSAKDDQRLKEQLFNWD